MSRNTFSRTAAVVILLVTVTHNATAGGPVATFVVDSTRDDPPGMNGLGQTVNCNAPAAGQICTLRTAMTQTRNATPGTFEIHFNIQATDAAGNANLCAGGTCSILPATELPSLHYPVTINGLTQTGGTVCTDAIAARGTYPIEIRGDGSAQGIRLDREIPVPFPPFTYPGAHGSTIRGLNISGFSIFNLAFLDVDDAQAECNFIGTTPDGTAANVNPALGIFMHCDAQRNTIGGATAAQGNLIAGHVSSSGIQLWGGSDCGEGIEGPDDTVIQNNFIGTTKSGAMLLGNRFSAIEAFGAGPIANTLRTDIRQNVLGGGGETGIYLDVAASQTTIQSNAIGTDFAGTAILSNGTIDDGPGILIDGAALTQIGGPGATDPNLIANNANDGVRVSGASAVDNRISRNSMFDNGDKGIELNSGGNAMQVAPIIQDAVLNGAMIDITYQVPTGAPSLEVEFFLADASGSQGETYLGNQTYTGAGSSQMVSLPAPMGTTVIDLVVATAADPTGDTSEFSVGTLLPIELLDFAID